VQCSAVQCSAPTHTTKVFEDLWSEQKLRSEGTGDWRDLHNEELNDQYSSPNIVRVIK